KPILETLLEAPPEESGQAQLEAWPLPELETMFDASPEAIGQSRLETEPAASPANGPDSLAMETIKLFGGDVYAFLPPTERITLVSAVGMLKMVRATKPSLPCLNVFLFPFASVYRGFIIKLVLLKFDYDLPRYHKDRENFPIEHYVCGRALGRFIVGRPSLYGVLDRIIKVWDGLRCLDTKVDTTPAPGLDGLVSYFQLEDRIAEMAESMREAYSTFVCVSSKDHDYDLFVSQPLGMGSKNQIFHATMAVSADGQLRPDQTEETGEVPDMARPIYSPKAIAWNGPYDPALASGPDTDQGGFPGKRTIPSPPRLPNLPDMPTLQGKPEPQAPAWFRELTESPKLSAPPALGSKPWAKAVRPTKPMAAFAERIGTDESGKGDYFGPLVVAGVYLDSGLAEKLERIGVRDSKANSDAQNLAQAKRIKEILGKEKYRLEAIFPTEYNRRHSEIGNLNLLLAEAHAEVIGGLLSKVACSQAVIDQFAKEGLIMAALEKKGLSVEVFQTPKAERDLAVAAASILARAGFLTGLGQLGDEYGLKLVKGASSAVDRQIRDIHRNHGLEALGKLGKLHFANTGKAGVRLT
ncbi:MAG: ribonuclease HIII, partial [Deltaproteobacteria bacterium]|nr:ribonuclease HIII [Deltaproteobacteria bacterium]